MSNTSFRPARVAVVGAGNVGSSFAYALLLSGLASEIILMDANQARAEGEALDLGHSVPFAHPTRVRAGSYADCAGADIVVITAGANQKPGESRLELGQRNAAIFGQIVPAICQGADFQGVLLIATNPVDAMTYQALKLSGLPSQRVFGSGTVLDTGRFRYLIGQHFGVDPGNVDAYIIGEHGDSEVPVWSLASIGGLRLQDYCAAMGLEYSTAVLDEIYVQTRDAAQHIIQRKGATYYAIGAGLLRIVEAVLRDQNTILPVTSLLEGYEGLSDVCLGLPTIVNSQGAARIVPLPLNEEERNALQRSAEAVRKVL